MSVSRQTAVHLMKEFSENARSTRNQSMRSLKQLFHVSGKLITDHKEITGFPVFNWQQLTWQSSTLLTDKAVQFATAKTFVLSDSVLCLGVHQYRSRQIKEGEDQIFHGIRSIWRIGANRWRADGVRVTKISQIQNMMTGIKCEPEHFQGRIIFMSMHNDIDWKEKTRQPRKLYFECFQCCR